MPNFIEIRITTRLLPLLKENRHARLLAIRDNEQKTPNGPNQKFFFSKLIKKNLKLMIITKKVKISMQKFVIHVFTCQNMAIFKNL